MKIFLILLGSLALYSCDKAAQQTWCETRTVASLKSLQGTSPTSNWCATLDAKLVFVKDATKGCNAGAFYLQDSTGSLFVCDPNVKKAVPDSGVVTCPSFIRTYVQDTSLSVGLQAEGLFYPAKKTCSELLCDCQNGIELDRVEKTP